MEAYMGYVMFTAGTYAPSYWALCQGQTLSIAQNTALYSLLGVTFGGDGNTTFAIPHLGGRTPVGTGQAPGVSHNYALGELGGNEQTMLTTAQMPMHVHATPATAGMAAVTDNTNADTSSTPTQGARLGAVLDTTGSGETPPAIYVPAGSGSATVNLAGGGAAGTTSVAGGSQPMSIMQPYLALNAVICMTGLYPPRP